jgi:hypothetical protein
MREPVTAPTVERTPVPAPKKRGRKPKGERGMTSTERSRLRRTGSIEPPQEKTTPAKTPAERKRESRAGEREATIAASRAADPYLKAIRPVTDKYNAPEMLAWAARDPEGWKAALKSDIHEALTPLHETAAEEKRRFDASPAGQRKIAFEKAKKDRRMVEAAALAQSRRENAALMSLLGHIDDEPRRKSKATVKPKAIFRSLMTGKEVDLFA